MKINSTYFLILTAVFLVGCGDEPAKSLFDPNAPSKPQPIINSLIPPDSSLAGAGEITISGQNFSSNTEENLVFFNQFQAEVLEASTDQLIIRPPNLVGDSIQIKIAVQGAELFSEPKFYKLIPAVSDFADIFEGDIAYGIASDRDGNVFFHVVGREVEIKKVSPDGTTTLFATPTFLRANGMKMGPDNMLYVAPSGRNKIIATFAPDGTQSVFVSLGPRTLPEPEDLDFDSNGNLWVVGGSIVFLVKADKTVAQIATFPVQRLQTVRVFDGFLYLAGNTTDIGGGIVEQKIWRSEIQEEILGSQEVVLDATAADWLEGASVNAITFAEDGDMILGTNKDEDAIFILHPDGTHETLYPGLISPDIYAISWSNELSPIGDGQILYAVRQFVNPDTEEDNSVIFRIIMGKRSAPYYGR